MPTTLSSWTRAAWWSKVPTRSFWRWAACMRICTGASCWSKSWRKPFNRRRGSTAGPTTIGFHQAVWKVSPVQDFHQEDVLGKAYDARLMRRLLRYARPFAGWMLVAFVLMLLITASELVRPYLVRIAIDEHLLSFEEPLAAFPPGHAGRALAADRGGGHRRGQRVLPHRRPDRPAHPGPRGGGREGWAYHHRRGKSVSRGAPRSGRDPAFAPSGPPRRRPARRDL